MFDIGFGEILLIAVVALLVIGPERLPKVARTLGHLFGRLQRYVNEVKTDINREIELEELRKLQSQMQDAAHSIEQSVRETTQSLESDLQDIERTATAEVTAENSSPETKVMPAEPSVR